MLPGRSFWIYVPENRLRSDMSAWYRRFVTLNGALYLTWLSMRMYSCKAAETINVKTLLYLQHGGAVRGMSFDTWADLDSLLRLFIY